MKDERRCAVWPGRFGCPRRLLAWIPVAAGTGPAQFQRRGLNIHVPSRPDRGSVQALPEPPDADRLFRAIMARIEAGEADVSAPEIPIDHPDSSQTSVAKGSYRR